MRTQAALLLFVLTLTALPATAGAQALPPSGSIPQQGPDAAQQCMGCHGARGEGIPTAGFPRIAGQPDYYLAKQLRDYADGLRRNPAMEAISKTLSAQEIADVARFFSQLDPPPAHARATAEATERGQQLATVGDAAHGVQACSNCHGPDGVGEPPAIPYLAGLDATYLLDALAAWKTGSRRNDPGGQMATVALLLTAEDAAAVAGFYASLQPPSPVAPALVQAGEPSLGPIGGTTPVVSEAEEPAAAGTGQSAPTGGATHGRGAADTDTETGAEAPAPQERGRQRQAAPPTALGDGDPARGRAIVAGGTHGCAACHAIPGIRSPRGIVGPPLGGMAERTLIAGQLPNEPAVLAAFLENPPALVPATGMPDVGLTTEDARHVAAYLYTLEPGNAR